MIEGVKFKGAWGGNFERISDYKIGDNFSLLTNICDFLMDSDTGKCVYINDICLPTKEKDVLTQHVFDNIKLIRLSLEELSCQVQKITF